MAAVITVMLGMVLAYPRDAGMAAPPTSRYQKYRSRKVFVFANAINKIDILFREGRN